MEGTSKRNGRNEQEEWKERARGTERTIQWDGRNDLVVEENDQKEGRKEELETIRT